MTATAWTLTNEGRTKLLDGTFDIDTDTWKMGLYQSTSNIGAASTTIAGVTNEVANNPGTTGYTTGGTSVTLSLSGTTTVTADSTDASWNPVSATLTARFAVIYEVSGRVLCYCTLDDTPADVSVTAGNVFTVQIATAGLFTLA